MSEVKAKLDEAMEHLKRLQAALEEAVRLLALEGREDSSLNKLTEAVSRWDRLLDRLRRMEEFRGGSLGG